MGRFRAGIARGAQTLPLRERGRRTHVMLCRSRVTGLECAEGDGLRPVDGVGPPEVVVLRLGVRQLQELGVLHRLVRVPARHAGGCLLLVSLID